MSIKFLSKRKVLTFGILGILLFLSIIISGYIYLLNKIYPGIYVAAVHVGGLSREEVSGRVEQVVNYRLQNLPSFAYQNQTFKILPQKVKLNPSILDLAYEYGHTKVYRPPVDIKATWEFDPSLEGQINEIASKIDQPVIESQIKISEGQVSVSPSQPGYILDKEELNKQLNQYFNTGKLTSSNLPIKEVLPKLSYENALRIKEVLDQIKDKPLVVSYGERQWSLDFETILNMADLESSPNTLASLNIFKSPVNLVSVNIASQNITGETNLTLKEEKLKPFLEKLASEIDQPVVEPLIAIDPTSDPKKPRVTQFNPPQQGKKLNITQATVDINRALAQRPPETVSLPVETIEPKNQLSNDLGIKELIGRGVSNYAGSIPNRIYNIGLAASKINGVLIAPGETFSFVNTVGDISAASGYKQAYVIQSGRTVLGDGGGVCQVSTTLFRSVLNSGLPVVNRVAHAYRVGYYEQGFPPGLDATIYNPTVDFQFKNDTPAHILIQAYTTGTTLYVDFYGTSDGRVASVSKPIITNQTPAPPELRQDDPTLPKDTIKQVDFAAAGANVVFTRTVKRGGEVIINDTFRSNYRPWQAVFLVGTKEN